MLLIKSLLILLLMTGNCFAAFPPSLNDPTFLADYSSGVLNATRSAGSFTATYAASRDSTHPATYFDNRGIMQKTETANVGRFTYGYYDTTGFHSWADGKQGLMIEAASTNLFVMGLVDGNCAFNGNDVEYSGTARWAVRYSDTGASTNTIDSDSNTFGGKSIKIVITNAGGTAPTNVRIENENALTLTDGVVYTVSFWIKSSTAITIPIKIFEIDDDFTTYNLLTGPTTVADTWIRYSETFTFDVQAHADPATDVVMAIMMGQLGTPTINIESLQIEVSPFATSFVPTTTAALTRNVETLKYETSGNRTAATESCVVKLAPEYADSVTAVANYIQDTDTKQRKFYFNTTANDVFIAANETDTPACNISDIINEAWVANTEMTLGWAMQSTGNPNISGYYNGIADGTNNNTDFTAPAWGTYFHVGNRNDGVIQLNGTIFSIAFWDRVLTATEFSDTHTYGWQPKAFKRASPTRRNRLRGEE